MQESYFRVKTGEIEDSLMICYKNSHLLGLDEQEVESFKSELEIAFLKNATNVRSFYKSADKKMKIIKIPSISSSEMLAVLSQVESLKGSKALEKSIELLNASIKSANKLLESSQISHDSGSIWKKTETDIKRFSLLIDSLEKAVSLLVPSEE